MINILSPQVANLIAAGEVVDRPASAVKELLENSIDAGADKVTVEIKGGGAELIRVTDNGCGMDENDVKKCVFRHATSKIATSDDLNGIATLGFRGEALAAISSVSTLRIMTKKPENAMGTLAVFEAGELKSIGESGCPNGTTIMVENLFDNVPARKKFLRRAQSETAAVSAVIEKIALSRPDISINYLTDGVQKLRTNGDGRLLNAIYAVLGRDFASKVKPVDDLTEGITIRGFIGTPENCRSNRNGENFFINGRFVRCATASAALEQAFSSYMMKEHFPTCVLAITFNPALVDVNVHPQKLEVKFSNEKPVFNAVYCAVRNVLQNALDRPAGSPRLTRLDGDSFRMYGGVMTGKAESPDEAKRIAEERELSESRYQQIKLGEDAPTEKTASDEIDISDPYAVDNSRKREQENPLFTVGKSCGKGEEYPTSGNMNGLWTLSPVSGKKPDKTPENGTKQAESVTNGSQSHPVDNYVEQAENTPSEGIGNGKNDCVRFAVKNPAPLPEYSIKGVLFNCYIIVQTEGKALVIDKHAAHERIIFEKLKANLSGGKPAMQTVLLPVEVPLSGSEYEAAEANRAELERIGFVFGERGLTAYPLGMSVGEAKNVFSELVGRLSEGVGDVTTDRRIMLEKALFQASCKAAVKGGREDLDENIDWIVRQVLTRPEVRYCPHGRPVAVEMTESMLEKRFERT